MLKFYIKHASPVDTGQKNLDTGTFNDYYSKKTVKNIKLPSIVKPLVMPLD